MTEAKPRRMRKYMLATDRAYNARAGCCMAGVIATPEPCPCHGVPSVFRLPREYWLSA